MNVLFILVPLALLLAGLGVWAFAWAVRRGQFDDVHTPALRMLVDEEENPEFGDLSGEARAENERRRIQDSELGS